MPHTVTRPESEEKIASMFDRIADRYDLLNSLLSVRQDRSWRRKMVQMLPLIADNTGKILDVATGTGAVIQEIGDRRSDYNRAVGIDISARMLGIARSKLIAHSTRITMQPELLQMSAENLLFEGKTFDAVTISFGLRNVVRRERALVEMFRVLKPGGKLVILEFFKPQNNILARLFLFYFHYILPRIGGIFSDKQAYTYLPNSVEGFCSTTDLIDQLRKTGFTNFQQVSFLFGGCRLIAADRPGQ